MANIEHQRARLISILVVHFDMPRDRAEKAADLYLHDQVQPIPAHFQAAEMIDLPESGETTLMPPHTPEEVPQLEAMPKEDLPLDKGITLTDLMVHVPEKLAQAFDEMAENGQLLMPSADMAADHAVLGEDHITDAMAKALWDRAGSDYTWEEAKSDPDHAQQVEWTLGDARAAYEAHKAVQPVAPNPAKDIPNPGLSPLRGVIIVPPMPETDDLKPYGETISGHTLEGYTESTSEWIERNYAAVQWLIDNHKSIRAVLEQLQPVAPVRRGKRYKHLKRGTTYTSEEASFQVSVPLSPDLPHSKGRVVIDGDTVIVYRDEESHALYVRYPDEFTPDRFEEL